VLQIEEEVEEAPRKAKRGFGGLFGKAKDAAEDLEEEAEEVVEEAQQKQGGLFGGLFGKVRDAAEAEEQVEAAARQGRRGGRAAAGQAQRAAKQAERAAPQAAQQAKGATQDVAQEVCNPSTSKNDGAGWVGAVHHCMAAAKL
jgi:hypothetical protein